MIARKKNAGEFIKIDAADTGYDQLRNDNPGSPEFSKQQLMGGYEQGIKRRGNESADVEIIVASKRALAQIVDE